MAGVVTAAVIDAAFAHGATHVSLVAERVSQVEPESEVPS